MHEIATMNGFPPIDSPHEAAATRPSRVVKLIVHCRARYQKIAFLSDVLGRSYPLCFACAVVAILMAACLLIFGSSFQTNDDAWMAMIVAGKGICLAPDEHLIFSNIVLGKALSQLYSAFPVVPWYGAHLYLLQFLANAAMFFCAAALGTPRRALAMFGLYFAIVGAYFATNLHYTTTAFLAVQAGAILCLTVGLRRPSPLHAPSWQLLAGGVLLMVWGAIVRTDSFFLAMLAASAPLAVLLVRRGQLSTALPVCGAVAASLAAVLCLNAYNHAYYERDPEWSKFYSFNALRLKFNDYRWTSYTPDSAPIFNSVGWTANDHEMIAHWFFDDANRFGEQQLRTVLDRRDWRAQRQANGYWRSAFREMCRDKVVWYIGLSLPFAALLLRRNFRGQLAVASAAAMVALLLVAIALLMKPPPARTYVPALAFPLALAMVLPRNERRPAKAERELSISDWFAWGAPQPGLRFALVATLLMATAAVGMHGVRLTRKGRKTAAAREDLARYTQQLGPQDDLLFVTWASSYPFELISPLDNLRSFEHFHIFSLSWPQTAPWQQELKRRFQVTDILRAFYERSDVRMIATKDLWPLYAKYVEEHHGRLVQIRPVGPTQTLQPELRGETRLASPISWQNITR